MEFLPWGNKQALGEVETPPINVAGKHVVILGGGDTGADCLGTSIRQGAASITQLEIMPQPPLQRAANNPWPEWPKVYKMDYGQEEAAARQGDDPRVYLTTVRKFAGGAGGIGRPKAWQAAIRPCSIDVEARLGKPITSPAA